MEFFAEAEADRRQVVDAIVHKMVGKDNTESRLLFAILHIVDYDEEFCEEIIRGNQKIVTEAIEKGFVNIHLLKAQIDAERETKVELNELRKVFNRFLEKAINEANRSNPSNSTS